MQDLHSLLKKYWAGTSTIEEQILLLKLLSEDPEGIEQGLRTAYESDLVNRIDVLSRQKSEEMLERILKRKQKIDSTKKVPAKVVYWSKRWGTWAAAVVIVILAGAAFYTFSGHSSQRPAPVAVAAHPVRKVERYSNTGEKKTVVHLNDRSVVVLLPKSSISYDEASADGGRNIELSGKAYFKVARDPARPFTVFSNAIATTVLGTEFTISTLTDGKVTIRLINGKVMVHAKDTGYRMSGLYLEPGQEATIDTRNRKARLNSFDVKAEERLAPVADHGASGIESSDMTFDKVPLAEVFDRLRKKYHVPIVYQKEDIKGLQFTGTFRKNDSLPMLLSVVCNMNGLVFRQETGKISIHKTD